MSIRSSCSACSASSGRSVGLVVMCEADRVWGPAPFRASFDSLVVVLGLRKSSLLSGPTPFFGWPFFLVSCLAIV